MKRAHQEHGLLAVRAADRLLDRIEPELLVGLVMRIEWTKPTAMPPENAMISAGRAGELKPRL